MTRKEERFKEAVKYTDEHHSLADNDFQDAMRISVMKAHFDASKWADRTMFDKVCEWLEDNMYKYLYINKDFNEADYKHELIEDLRKAMGK